MDFLSIFSIWLILFSMIFTLLPIVQVMKWRKDGTSDGFSSINFVMQYFMLLCWLKFGFMASDKINIFLNSFNLALFTIYLIFFAIYQTHRRNILGQLAALVIAVCMIFTYVESQPSKTAVDTMGSVAAIVQIFSLCGQIYDIRRAIGLKHTEYIPAEMQLGIFLLVLQWILFAAVTYNYYILVANVAALAVNMITLSLYFFYPPLTWRVPIIGTGPQIKKKE